MKTHDLVLLVLSGFIGVAFLGIIVAAHYSEPLRNLLPREHTIDGERLVLRDRNGRMRAELVVTTDDAAVFSLTDHQEKKRLQFAVDPDGAPRIALFDAQGTSKALVRVDADGLPAVDLFDESGTNRLGLRLDADGAASVALFDGDAHQRLEIGAERKGETGLSLFDADGHRRCRLDLHDGGAGISFADSTGTGRAILAFADRIGPSLVITDPTGKIQAMFGGTDVGPRMTMNGNDGHVRIVLDVLWDEVPRLSLYDQEGKVLFAVPTITR